MVVAAHREISLIFNPIRVFNDLVEFAMLSMPKYLNIGTFFVKFMLSKKTTKIDKIFTVDMTLCSKCQIDGEDFINFCGILGKHKFHKFTKKNLRLNYLQILLL